MAPLIRARIGIYESAMSALDRDGVRVILRGMDVARQRKKYRYPHSPHSVVLQHTLERINDLARDEQCNALVIADELPSQEDHRTELDTYRSLGTPGYRSSRLPRLLDTIHFAPSKYSRLLQAADLIAFLFRRRETHEETDKRARRANDRIWAPIEGRIWHQGFWTP